MLTIIFKIYAVIIVFDLVLVWLVVRKVRRDERRNSND